MTSRVALLACVLVFVSLYSVVSADYAYSGCYLYSSTGGAPTNTFWAPFLPGNINLLNCSKICQGTLQGYFGMFETQCACQASNSPALTPVATTMCNYFLGGTSNGNIYVSGFTTPSDRVPYMTNQVPTMGHQYHDMGCYRVYNFQYGDDGPHDTINEPIFGTQHETLDNEGHISAIEQCAEICQSKFNGIFGIFQATCFCQEETFVPAAAISVDNSHCDSNSVTVTDQYQGNNGGSHRHEYHYIRLYQFAPVVPATSPPPTTPAPTVVTSSSSTAAVASVTTLTSGTVSLSSATSTLAKATGTFATITSAVSVSSSSSASKVAVTSTSSSTVATSSSSTSNKVATSSSTSNKVATSSSSTVASTIQGTTTSSFSSATVALSTGAVNYASSASTFSTATNSLATATQTGTSSSSASVMQSSSSTTAH